MNLEGLAMPYNGFILHRCMLFGFENMSENEQCERRIAAKNALYEFFSVGCFVSTLSALFYFRRKLLTSFSVFRFSASFYCFVLSHFTSTFTQKWFFCLVNDTPNHEDRSPFIVSFFSCLSVPFYMLTAPRYNLYLRRCIFKTIFSARYVVPYSRLRQTFLNLNFSGKYV